MAKLSRANKMVKCSECGNLTHSAVGGSNTGLCPTCYDVAGLENEHADGEHVNAPHASCPDCKAPASERKVAPGSIGARLDARGLKHRQFCAGGKHLVEVSLMTDVVFTGSTAELAAWLDSFAAQSALVRQYASALATVCVERPAFRVRRTTPDGPQGWDVEGVPAWTEGEADALASSARKMPRARSVAVDKL
jgi:hypothetical protein